MDDRFILSRLSATSLGEVLECMRPRIPTALLDGRPWERVLSCAHDLPAETAGLTVFLECRLQSPIPAADLIVSAPVQSGLCRHYMERGAAADADAGARALGWFLREAERDGSFLSRMTGGIMCEYDLAADIDGAGAPPSPGIFVAPPGYRPGAAYGADHENPGLLTAMLAAVSEQPERTGERRALEEMFAALPAKRALRWGGVFPGRRRRMVYAAVVIEETDLPDTLHGVRWPGSAAAATAVLSGLRERSADFMLGGIALEVADGGVQPRLGLELYQGPSWIFNSGRVWRDLIEALVKQGWCRPEKAAGLQAWTGAEPILDRNGAFLLRQGINHIKISLEDGGIEAKAYLCARLSPLEEPGPGR